MSAIRHIRIHVFGVTQAEFAVLARSSQASVSRWETGVAPSLDDMAAIREAAFARGIAWDDGWFFELPVPAEPVGEPQRPAAGNPDDLDNTIDAVCPAGVVTAGPDLPNSQAGTGLSLQKIQETAE